MTLIATNTALFAQPAPESLVPVGAGASPASGVSLPLQPAVTSPRALGPSTLSYALFMRSAEVQPGVIDLVRKDDELFLDLKPENFDKPYLVMPSIAKGIGGDTFAGRVYDPLEVIFKRVGQRVLWMTPNTHYVADPGSSAAASLAISVAGSVLFATPIVAESAAKDHVIISPSIFLSDFEGVGADLGSAVGAPTLPGLLALVARPSFAVDRTKSYYVRTKAFPLNDEISVNLAFNGPANALPTVPDGRGIPIVMHYSILAPPEHDPSYVPRYADDRIGYFISARKHYGNDDQSSPFERFIDRWDLNDGPIVFTLTNEIPPEYRDTVRRAILTWNQAFARLGYGRVIEVRDPPSDPSFDPDDIRYNSVRWITSDGPSFAAYTPHDSDPETGQIIRAQVVIDGEALRTVRRGFVNQVEPVESQHFNDAFVPGPPRAQTMSYDDEEAADAGCDVEATSAVQAAVGMSDLLADPTTTAAQRDRYVQDWLFSVVVHEVGHALGLRHNFLAPTEFTPAQLRDPAFTAAHGISASVMAYNPANLFALKQKSGSVFATKLGTYDLWAIQYGYTKTGAKRPADETAILSRIASRSTEPGHAFGTDEDVIEPYALDPRIARFDLSSDPLAFDQRQFTIDDDLALHLMRSTPGESRSYQDIRQAFITTLDNQLSAAMLTVRYIGGIYTSYDHRGQAGGEPPFRSIPRAEQRRAFALIDRYVFSAHAFNYPANLLNDAAPVRFGLHWDSGGLRRSDFPIREVITEIQDATIAEMFAPAALARIADQELKEQHSGETMSLADLFAWTNAAFYDDLGQPAITPTRLDLQRRFGDLEIEIALLPSSALDRLGLPRELQALARYNLRRLQPRLDVAYRRATDVTTKAALDDLRSRVNGALRPNTNRPL